MDTCGAVGFIVFTPFCVFFARKINGLLVLRFSGCADYIHCFINKLRLKRASGPVLISRMLMLGVQPNSVGMERSPHCRGNPICGWVESKIEFFLLPLVDVCRFHEACLGLASWSPERETFVMCAADFLCVRCLQNHFFSHKREFPLMCARLFLASSAHKSSSVLQWHGYTRVGWNSMDFLWCGINSLKSIFILGGKTFLEAVSEPKKFYVLCKRSKVPPCCTEVLAEPGTSGHYEGLNKASHVIDQALRAGFAPTSGNLVQCRIFHVWPGFKMLGVKNCTALSQWTADGSKLKTVGGIEIRCRR